MGEIPSFVGVRGYAVDEEAAARLWRVSVEMTAIERA
jgi:hypothetical protein